MSGTSSQPQVGENKASPGNIATPGTAAGHQGVGTVHSTTLADITKYSISVRGMLMPCRKTCLNHVEDLRRSAHLTPLLLRHWNEYQDGNINLADPFWEPIRYMTHQRGRFAAHNERNMWKCEGSAGRNYRKIGFVHFMGISRTTPRVWCHKDHHNVFVIRDSALCRACIKTFFFHRSELLEGRSLDCEDSDEED